MNNKNIKQATTKNITDKIIAMKYKLNKIAHQIQLLNDTKKQIKSDLRLLHLTRVSPEQIDRIKKFHSSKMSKTAFKGAAQE